MEPFGSYSLKEVSVFLFSRISMFYKTAIVVLALSLSGCSGKEALNVTRALLGYTPPPEETTVAEELRIEYKRCMKIGEEDNCAQAAYDVVRKVKGLDPRVIPEGYVIILEGDDGRTSQDESEEKPGDKQEEKKEEKDKN